MFAILLMLFIILVLLKPNINKQLYLFIATLVVTVFFESSKDPIIGMPLYFYVMLVSSIYTIVKCGFEKKQWPIMLIITTVLILLIQMVNLANGNNVMECILLKQSNTDTLDIASQLMTPTLNFTVFKHFAFMLAYMLWAYANMNLLKDQRIYTFIYQTFQKTFKILFVAIIVECMFINLTGINTRTIVGFLFNVSLNMKTSWEAWGLFTCACAWLTEPSSIGIVLIYYMMLFTKKEYKVQNAIWILISYLAVFMTGSSTGLFIALIFGALILIDSLLFISRKSSLFTLIFTFIGIVSVLFVLMNQEVLFSKVNTFLSNDRSYSSGFFRKQSIEYALNNFNFSPLIGLGIGTVYCHSGLLQILSNIGILGTLNFAAFHISLMPKSNCGFSFKTLIKTLIFICVLYASLMIQTLTSPYFLVLVICITSNFDSNEHLGVKRKRYNEKRLCNSQLQ